MIHGILIGYGLFVVLFIVSIACLLVSLEEDESGSAAMSTFMAIVFLGCIVAMHAASNKALVRRPAETVDSR